MRFTLSLISCLCFILLPFHGLDAQSGYQFQNFTQKDGLSSNFVLRLIQDHQGFIWIGTENGLNRFDGKHFISFKYDPEDTTSVNGNWVTDIYEDREHQLWVGTTSGLSCLDRQTGKFKRILLEDSTGNSLPYHVTNIHESTNQHILFTTLKSGIFQISKKSSSSFPQKFDYTPSHDSIDLRILHILEQKDDLYIFTNQGIDKLNQRSKKVEHFPLPPLRYGFINSEIERVRIADDLQGRIWLTFGLPGAFYFDPNEKEPHILAIENFIRPQNKSSAPKGYIGDVSLASADKLYFAIDRGIGLLNLKTKSYKVINEISPLFKHDSHAILVDRDKNIWVGSAGNGLIMGIKSSSALTFYQHDPLDPSTISTGPVRSFAEDEKGNLWVSMLESGVDQLVYDSDNYLKKVNRFRRNPQQSNSLLSNNIIKIIRDQSGNYWLATNDNGLNKVDFINNSYDVFEHDINDPTTISGNRLWGLTEGNDGDIWVGSFSDGLNRIDKTTGQIQRIKHDPSNTNSLIDNNVKCLFTSRDGHIWIGTKDGLSQLNPTTMTFTNYIYNSQDNRSISSNFVWCIFEDSQENIWIGTNLGLNKLDKASQTFKRFYEKDGLPSNAIYGMIEDNLGAIWISTDDGLARLTENNNEVIFQPLKSSNGLPTSSFLPKAYHKSKKTGELFFGSTDGILAISPHFFETDSIPPQIVLHAFSKFKEKLQFRDYFISNKSTSIKLTHLDEAISFTLADLNAYGKDTYQYEYSLKGANDQWMKLGDNMTITFPRLNAGNYVLKARGININQEASEEVFLANINVYPPWWWSNIAKFIYVLAMIGGILAIYRYQLRRQLLEQEARKLKELDETKSRFFTNISHEFRTPLTIISGMMDQIEKNPRVWLKDGAEMIRRNNANLLNLVNQIMELQKLESGNMELNMHLGDVVPFLQSIAQQFQAFGQSKKQHLEFVSEVESLQMDYDPEKYLRIVSNLLSNAIKYTPEGGVVSFSVSSGQLAVGNYLLITVSDTGKGIPKNQIPYIFDRFFQASSNEKWKENSTGIGLALTLELVKLLGGKIEVHSEENKGTSFQVFLPITQKATTKQPKEPLNIQSKILGKNVPTVIEKVQTGDLPLALIVEDNLDIAQYLKICLSGAYRTIFAIDGQEGIEQALAQVPDVIISDVMMPKKNGFELCDMLKEDIRTSHIPIILLTAKSDVDSRIFGLKQGADDYLSKPFHEEELLVRMRNLLENRRRLQERYKDIYAHPISIVKAPIEDTPIEKETIEKKQKEDEFILKLKGILEGRMNDPAFGLNELSEEFHLSRSQLGRKIKALTGRSAAVYIRSLRLQKARQLLQQSELSIKEIAYDTGFSDPAYFSRTYTAEYGESPSQTASL